jgi:hypothetical protein
MDRNDRETRDAAGVGPYAGEREKLTALSSLDSWTVSEGEPDIRGWEVRTVNNRQLGTVEDLLIDAQAGEVVMIDVDLPGSDRHTFVPIRVVQVDRARRIVLMDSADLPSSDAPRADRATRSERRAAEVVNPGSVRYPKTDREVIVERPVIDDDIPPREATPADDALTAAAIEDRRRAERRRIQRLSTNI